MHGLFLLLPFFEQQNLYNSFNRTAAFSNLNHYNKAPLASPDAITSGNAALSVNKISILLCPSDNGQPYISLSANYSPDLGAGILARKSNYDFVVEYSDIYCNYWSHAGLSTQRMFGQNSTTRITDISDGTSNTFAMTEGTLNAFNGSTTAWAYRGWVNPGIDPAHVSGAAIPPQGLNIWQYYTQTTPTYGQRASWNIAASMHTNGVNFVFADGSVHFISQSIDQVSLTYLTTMADGMVIPNPQY